MPISLLVKTVLGRVKEPSSWSGVAVLLAMFGLSHEQTGAITELLAAGAALASVFIAEKGDRS
ncbi:hypothetical protein Mmc1_2760 [Magnetococcus marinus MC-1]|uniref:Uncharacterized protein n=1 Tax=Magnetococcus marinus (strain ATCC BAA-1437 / JCM 17883 / MC-1) TaxID=156889 RepID=A0L713_MAGMM|nr:hypothetical protein [Magnetococcus marinus]ABK43756.1 hypothetical protein Mmc1_1245 [Magnetococcus marinus MC-1]ABK44563.1 hypothetical protein Mmc1_2062 [Magnetococcus marinus MC-1]ABK45253.1 hypothetical protein Mmc1_2760 [Magnetococcus marinus MC-1]